jgi:hypothetical protein
MISINKQNHGENQNMQKYKTQIINYPRSQKIDGRNDIEFIGFSPIDFYKTMNDEEFKFLLSESKRYRMYKYKNYKNTITHVEELMNLIEKYVNIPKAK